MMAIKVTELEGGMVKNRECTRVSPERGDLYSLVLLASTGGAAAEAKMGIVVSQMMMVQMLAAVVVAVWRVRCQALFNDSC
jgi:hypothetical protein